MSARRDRGRTRTSSANSLQGYSGRRRRDASVLDTDTLQDPIVPARRTWKLIPLTGSRVVYAKPPFAGAERVLEYVGRYTHRVAIANNRIVDIEDGKVRFRWKDYRDENRQKVMTLDAREFIRRFLVHVLPEGFQRIRYYGFMGNRYRKQKLARG